MNTENVQPSQEGSPQQGKIAPFKKGDRITVARMNEIVTALNSLLNIRIYRGPADTVFQSDSNTVLQVWYNE